MHNEEEHVLLSDFHQSLLYIHIFAAPFQETSMGGWLSSLFDSLWKRKEVRILILGLDNAGKTTILCEFRRIVR